MSRSISTSACGTSIGPTGLSIKRDAFEQHPGPAGRDPDAPFSTTTVADLRQIPLQKLIKLSVTRGR